MGPGWRDLLHLPWGKKLGSVVRPGAFPMPDLQQALHLWFGEINDMLIT